jgi:DNA invertase Pin-like site-specific DNA recombinase
MPPTPGNRAVLYLRVSTDRQAAEGHGLDAQRTRLTEYASSHGLQVVAVVTDGGESGGNLDRPGFKRVQEMGRNGEIDLIVATKSDRLSRNLRDLLNLATDFAELGCSIATADGMFDTGTAFGKAMTNMQGVFAELERDLIRERTREGLAAARAKGVRLGRPPVGYTMQNGQLVPNDPQKHALALRALTLKNEGMTLGKIADAFNAESIPTSMGGSWHAMTVKRLVRGPLEAMQSS